ncbi:hypothetical protein LRY60_01205 [Candidatus Woesebacteria bacterium]|nr:hypothetical protein [Candidatus Woesebacteria bacterium]
MVKSPLSVIRFCALVLSGLAVFGSGVLLSTLPAQAQFSAVEIQEATPVTASAEVVSVDPARLQNVTETYYANVEAYRDAAERYQIAEIDYYQQNTLASLEEAMRRARDLMRTRADLMESYFTYLRLLLQDTRGIELEDKNIADAEMAFWQQQMAEYRTSVAGLETRPQIQDHMELFNEQKNALLHSAYMALVLIKIGKIQTALDNAVTVRQTLDTAISNSSLSAADKAIKQRGLEEVDRLIQRSQNNVIDLQIDFRAKATQGAYNQQSYQAFQSDAEFSYLQLRQTGEYMNEIARGLQ